MSIISCANEDEYTDITGADDDVVVDDDNIGGSTDDQTLAQTLDLPATSFNYANI